MILRGANEHPLYSNPRTRHYPVHAAVTKNNGRHYRSEIMVADEEKGEGAEGEGRREVKRRSTDGREEKRKCRSAKTPMPTTMSLFLGSFRFFAGLHSSSRNSCLSN